MSIEKEAYPGTPRHQALLRAIVSHYKDDPRVRAVVVFGSLGRGDWDALSDLDLDVVLADGVPVDVAQEIEGLAAPFRPSASAWPSACPMRRMPWMWCWSR